MIRVVDEALRNLLEREIELVAELPVRVVLAPPPKELPSTPMQSGLTAGNVQIEGQPAQSGSMPAASEGEAVVSLFLYDLRENTSQREVGRRVERNGQQTSATVRRPTVYLDLAYAVSVQAASPDLEHALLAEVLSALIRHQILDLKAWIAPDSESGRWLSGIPDLRPFPLKIAQPEVLPDPIRFWQALGLRPRAGFSLLVTASMEPHPPVERPLVTHTVLGMPQDPRAQGITARVVHWVALAGTVTTETGTPLPGARISLVGQPQVATTDERGFYYFLNLAGGEYHVRAYAEGRSSAARPVKVPGKPGGGYPTADLVLTSAALVGTVTRAPGAHPVAHIPVRAGEHEVVTDSEGYFAFSDLPAGEYEVRAAVPGHGEQHRSAQTTGRPGEAVRVDLMLHPPALSGTVSDRVSGAAIRGASVEVSGQGQVSTDSHGYYSLANLPLGRYRVVACADGFQRAEQFIQLQHLRPGQPPAAAVLIFDLEPEGRSASRARIGSGHS